MSEENRGATQDTELRQRGHDVISPDNGVIEINEIFERIDKHLKSEQKSRTSGGNDG